MQIRLLAVLTSSFLFLSPGQATECQADFVNCVKSGKLPTECTSVLNSCDNARDVASDPIINSANIIQDFSRIEQDGEKLLRLQLTNTSKEPVDIGIMYKDFSCPSYRDKAVFIVNQTIQPETTITRDSGILCLGDGKRLLQHKLADDNKIEIICNSAKPRFVTLVALNPKTFKYLVSDGSTGSFTREQLDDKFLMSLCKELVRPPKNIIQSLKKFMLEIQNSKPKAGTLESETAVTGKRG